MYFFNGIPTAAPWAEPVFAPEGARHFGGRLPTVAPWADLFLRLKTLAILGDVYPRLRRAVGAPAPGLPILFLRSGDSRPRLHAISSLRD